MQREIVLEGTVWGNVQREMFYSRALYTRLSYILKFCPCQDADTFDMDLSFGGSVVTSLT